MTLTQNFLPVGSIVEYNGMINDIVGIIPPNPDKSKRFNNVWVVELSIGVICPLSDIKPIQLTPEILTEWCGAKELNNKHYSIGDRLFVNRDGIYFDYGSDTKLDYLHELQLLFLGFKTVLPITIK